MKYNLLKVEELSSILGIKKSTLNKWRCLKTYNLPYIKVGRLVRYNLEAVEAWIESRTGREKL
ncbi:MAG: helix-turn-helix domain-containing protein [Rickettsiales bacterium]|jgi:excisionase family DNA binding protein|nr:helix-turn-helix domain-containing protein [Rickettsiales bacterium]